MGRSNAVAIAPKLARGAGAVLLADLVVGMTSFSAISLGGLWLFSFGWIRLAAEYSQVGRSFGAPWQLGLAWVGELVCLPLVGVVLVLGAHALRVPLGLFRGLRRTPTVASAVQP